MLKMDEHTKVIRKNPTSREVVVSHTVDVQNNAPMDDTAFTTRFYFVDSTPPITPSSSTDTVEEGSPPSRCVSKGPLYELSELMVQLPLKRGLSKYFQGKSQSFKTLSSVSSIEDLAKRENPPRKKLKICMNDEVD